MASYIVEGAGPNGVRTWVVIEATSTSEARTKANQVLEEGFTPNISVAADASGVATLNSQSPGFSARFPSDYTVERIVSELYRDIAVVDIYIQKVAFVLYAGFEEKIRRRWVQRVIDNQLPDGGWNDRWLCFQSTRRPVLSLKQPPSNEHATVQAIWLLYQVKYRYPEHFGLK